MLKYGCFPKSQGNGSVYYKFESLDLRPDGVMVKGMQVVFDNGNLLTYKCKYYNIVQCSDFRNTLNTVNTMGIYTIGVPIRTRVSVWFQVVP